MTTKFEDVKDQTTEEYFEGNQFSIDVFKKKYRLTDDETYVQAIWRVCQGVASTEKTPELREYWAARWFDEIYNDWWHPAGSIMQGIGSGLKISVANCTFVGSGTNEPTEEWDSIEGIIRSIGYMIARNASYRQGLGFDMGRIRPRTLAVNNSSKVSSGAVHWMSFLDSIGSYVGQKGRIPAFLISLPIWHPDVEEFITVKSDWTRIQNANISVQVTDAFYDAVRGNQEWTMRFTSPEVRVGDRVYVGKYSATPECKQDDNGKYYYIAKHAREAMLLEKRVMARSLLRLIAENMFKNAEPGIQNIDVAKRMSTSDYLSTEDYNNEVGGTNACSEQYLGNQHLCVLSSINMSKFSTFSSEYKEQLEKIGSSINRFLDNVNEYELIHHTYSTDEQQIAIKNTRRTGAGVTNFAGWFFRLGVEYGSLEANSAGEEFMKWYNYYMYRNSIELGKEKGSFGTFDREKIKQAPFIKEMIGLGLKFDELRNITCSSIAPCGSLSLLFRGETFSYGVEPAFNIYYWKRTRISGKYEYYFCVPRVVRDVFANAGCAIPISSDSIKDTWDGKLGKPIVKFIEDNKQKVGIKFRSAPEVSPYDKLDFMSGLMKWVDSSISVTYMLPESTKVEDVMDFILLAHEKGVKSIAAFPDRQMYGIVSFEPFKDLAVRLTKGGMVIHEQNFVTEEIEELKKLTGTTAGSNKNIPPVIAPDRPDELPCDVYHVKVKGQDWFVLVGMFGNSPYEVFAGPNGQIDKRIKSGKIVKNKKKYYATFDGVDGPIDFGNIVDHCTDEQEAITRLVSNQLRHGVEIDSIVDQLQKVKSDDFQSFSRAMARALKKYIPDGKATGKKCPECKSGDLVYGEGCINCIACGWSKCS